MSAVGGKVSLLVARTERVHIYDAGAAHALIAFQYKDPGACERDFLRAFCGFARSQNIKNKNTRGANRTKMVYGLAQRRGGLRIWEFLEAQLEFCYRQINPDVPCEAEPC